MNKDVIMEVLHENSLTNTEKLLLISYYLGSEPKTITEVKKSAKELGLPEASQWNISDYFLKAKPKIIRLEHGWVLSGAERREIEKRHFSMHINPVQHQAIELRKALDNINDAATKSFLAEAISCAEMHPPLFRASVVLSWVGAISVLHQYVVKSKLKELNSEMIARARQYPHWQAAKNADDLGLIRESDFLDVLQSIGVIGKNVKNELKGCLDLRNGCGHPNSLVFKHNRVASHLEILTENVFRKFPA